MSFPQRRRLARLAALSVGIGLTAAACGSGGDVASPDAPATSVAASSSSSTDSDTGTAAPASDNLFAPVDVLDVANGGTVNLAAELGGGGKAVLLWFYAPH